MAVTRRTLATALILFAVLLSSLKILDDYADDYTSDAITSAAITYASARGINALVSMVQTSNFEAGIGVVSGSITVGELLDPVNDLVERFSTIMTLALASLAAQKILLLIASHGLFLGLVGVFGLASIAVIHFGKTAALGGVVKIFLVLVFVRFSLGLAVTLNSAVDVLFLEQDTRANDGRIAAFRHDLFDLGGRDDALDGESADLVERVRRNSLGFWRQLDLEQLERKIGDAIRSFMNLIAIYLLKTVVFPLLFFGAFYAVIRRLWAIRL